jgi:hypothetical protein
VVIKEVWDLWLKYMQLRFNISSRDNSDKECFHVTWLKESKRDPVVNLRLQFLTINEEKKGFICNRDSQVKPSLRQVSRREKFEMFARKF